MSHGMQVAITGVGWLDEAAYGGVRRGNRVPYAGRADLLTLRHADGIFAHPLRNAGRFDRTALLTCYAVALTLRDAGASYAEGRKLDIGLLGTNDDGCLEANAAYFNDYVACGRTLGRGNLFIYTLPSTPLAEAAIHFGLQGPLAYMSRPGNFLPELMRSAAGMVRRGDAAAMIALRVEPQRAVGLLFEPDAGREAACGADRAIALAGEATDVPTLVAALSAAGERVPR
jgi:3-oxoacyl-[acyl-carrier-protein] synthase II